MSPEFRHGKLTAVYLDEFDASPYLNSAESSQAIETAETTAFGNDMSKTYIAGQNDGTFSLGGMFDGTPDAVDERFGELAALNTAFPATLFYDAGVKIGRACRMAAVRKTTYDISTPVGDVVTISGELQCDGGVRRGRCLSDATARNSDVLHASVDWGASSASTNGGIVHIHVPHNTRNVATSVKVQHSSDNSVWVDKSTQSVSASTTGSFRLEVSGNVDRYVRATVTSVAGTGLVTAIVAFARK